MVAASTTLGSFESPISAFIQGASRGIGLEFVRQLVSDPAIGSIVASCRSPDGADDLRVLAHDSGKRLTLVPMDVTIESTVERAAARLTESGQALDLIVNCAGVLHDNDSGMRPERRLADIDPEQMIRSYRVNAVGPTLVAKHFHGLLSSRKKTVFASLSARVGSIGDNRLGGWYAYRAAKAAQNMITRNLSIELRRRRPDVICVALHPGTVDTDLSRPFQRNVPSRQLFPLDRAVRQLLSAIDSLTPQDNGGFRAFDGESIEW